MPNAFQSFFAEASAKSAKSTALHSLQWMLGILLSAAPILLFSRAPTWILVCLFFAVAVVLLLFTFAYVSLLIKQPDMLRSEHFTLSKMAIEKGLVGDSIHGLVELDRAIAQQGRSPAITNQGGAE